MYLLPKLLSFVDTVCFKKYPKKNIHVFTDKVHLQLFNQATGFSLKNVRLALPTCLSKETSLSTLTRLGYRPRTWNINLQSVLQALQCMHPTSQRPHLFSWLPASVLILPVSSSSPPACDAVTKWPVHTDNQRTICFQDTTGTGSVETAVKCLLNAYLSRGFFHMYIGLRGGTSSPPFMAVSTYM